MRPKFQRGPDVRSMIVVISAAQLAGNLRSDVAYLLDGVIPTGDTQITVPQGGLTILGIDLNVSGLTTSEAGHTLFIDDGVFSGNLFLRDMFVTVSGAGSQVFDLDNAGNFGAVECTMFNFVDCTSLGVLDSYRQGLWDGFAVIDCKDGLTMEGTWAGGFAILTSIIVSSGTAFTGTLLKKGTSLVVNGSIRSDINSLQLDDAGSICDFEPANIATDSGFLMTSIRANPDATSFPNMPASSVKARFSNCAGTANTHIGAQWTVTSTTVTNLSGATFPAYLKLEGTTLAAKLEWMTAPASNKLVNESSQPITVDATFNIGLSGTNNDGVKVKIVRYNSSDVSQEDVFISTGDTMNAGGRVEGANGHGFTTMASGDYLQLEANSSGDKDVTMGVDGRFTITERAS